MNKLKTQEQMIDEASVEIAEIKRKLNFYTKFYGYCRTLFLVLLAALLLSMFFDIPGKAKFLIFLATLAVKIELMDLATCVVDHRSCLNTVRLNLTAITMDILSDSISDIHKTLIEQRDFNLKQNRFAKGVDTFMDIYFDKERGNNESFSNGAQDDGQ